MTRTTYRQLQPGERMRIEIWKSEKVSLRAMARRLSRAPSSLTRELARNAQADAARYDALAAQRSTRRSRSGGNAGARQRAVGCRARDAGMEVVAPGDRRYAQANLSRRSQPTRVPRDDRQRHYAHPKGELRRELIACLRQGRAKRLQRSRGIDRRGQIPDMVSIHSCARSFLRGW